MAAPPPRLRQVFLLSPAHCGGRRASILMRPGAASPLAVRLREGQLRLGEAFSFMSGLYFRGKLTYALHFNRVNGPESTSLVITPTRGLQPPEMPVSLALLEEFARTDIASGGSAYREPLARDLDTLAQRLSSDATVVLLGSIATQKYVDVLAPALGTRLHFPTSFIGRGDMSRGGLLLRCAADNAELDYAPLDPSASRRGHRPPRLDRRQPVAVDHDVRATLSD
ncbi:MAG: hypothetical protein R2712_21155 [Vicinamibacterales bacterium]